MGHRQRDVEENQLPHLKVLGHLQRLFPIAVVPDRLSKSPEPHFTRL